MLLTTVHTGSGTPPCAAHAQAALLAGMAAASGGTIRALIMAARLDDWKRHTPNMVDPRVLLADALTNFYVTPNQRSYEIVRGIYARPRLAYAVDNDDFTKKLGSVVVGAVGTLSRELLAKISKELLGKGALRAAVDIPDDPRFGVFTLSLAAGRAIFVDKSAPAGNMTE